MLTAAQPGHARFPDRRAHPPRRTPAPTRRAAVTAPLPARWPPPPPAGAPWGPPPSMRPAGSSRSASSVSSSAAAGGLRAPRGPRRGKRAAAPDGKWGGGWRGRGGSFLLPGRAGRFLPSLGLGTRARAHTHTHAHIRAHRRIQARTHTHAHIRAHRRTQARTHAHTHTHTSTRERLGRAGPAGPQPASRTSGSLLFALARLLDENERGSAVGRTGAPRRRNWEAFLGRGTGRVYEGASQTIIREVTKGLMEEMEGRRGPGRGRGGERGETTDHTGKEGGEQFNRK